MTPLKSKLLLVLLAILASCEPAVAQETATPDAIITEQNDRVRVAYDRYIDACFEHDDLTDMQMSAMQSSGEAPGCTEAQNAYAREGDLLVRLMYGDPMRVVCMDDKTFTLLVEEVTN